MHVPGTTPTRYGDYPHRAMPQRNPWAKVGPTLLPAHARNVSHHTKTHKHMHDTSPSGTDRQNTEVGIMR